MATRTFSGTLDTFQKDSAASEITYLGQTAGGNSSDQIRAFRVNPGGTGDIKVTIDSSNALSSLEIFQEDAYNAGAAPAGYQKYYNIIKAGRGKGTVGVTVTNAAKNYVVLMGLDGYSEVNYNGNVVVP